MSMSDWQRVEAAFHEVHELPEAEAKQRLQTLFADEPALYAEALSLLESLRSSQDFLETNAFDRFASYLDNDPADMSAAPELDGFDIKHSLGSGGMGQVYVAEQHQPRRTVALKLIRRGVDRREHFYRFMAELQALAMMNHPNIAQVYQSGMTRNNIPYFTMEYVEGHPITNFCDREKLTIEQRLQLFVRVCRAIFHAHQKGVVHRDIKPSNILVKHHMGQALPKVIDFGIAKVFEVEGEDWRQTTIVGAVIGTPAYMSPEQADSARDIDTRSDLYTLGILLYELLIGKLPLKDDAYENKALSEVLKIIRETQAPRLASRFQSLAQEQQQIAQLRQTTPKELAKVLRGDLQRIVSKTLELDRDKRYEAVSELADDIQRYLDHQPISARPQTLKYLIAKYTRRNRKQLIIRVPLLGIFLFGLVLMAYIINENAKKTNAAIAVVQSYTNNLKESLQTGNLNQNKVQSTLPDWVLRTVDSQSLELVPPLDRASFFYELARAFAAEGNYVESWPQIDAAYQIYQQYLPPDDPDRLRAAFTYARNLYNRDRIDEAIELLQEVYQHRAKIFGPYAEETLETKRALADCLVEKSKWSEAQSIYREILDHMLQNTGGYDPFQVMITRHNLAEFYLEQKDYKSARQLHQINYDERSQAYGKASIDTISSQISLAKSYFYTGDEDEGMEMAKEATILAELYTGYFSEQTASAFSTLAVGSERIKDYVQAEAAFQKALEIYSELNGTEDTDTLRTMNNLADIYLKREKSHEALALKQEEQKARIRAEVYDHLESIMCMTTLGECYQAVADYQNANRLYLDLMRRVQENYPTEQAVFGLIQGLNAAALKGLGQKEQAEKELDEALVKLQNSPEWAGHVRSVYAQD